MGFLTVPLNLNSTVGCLFLTAIFTTVLWTSSTIQAYNYFHKYSRNDTLRLKAHVALVWLLDTAYEIVVLRISYLFFVTGFGNILTLDHMDKNTFSLITILSAFLMSSVQVLFVMRIWYLSKHSKPMTGIVIILVLAQFSITISYFTLIKPLTQFTQLPSIAKVSHGMNATIAFVDTAVAAILVSLLHTSRSGFKRTDSAINKLIYYTVASGMLTGVDALLAFIFSLTLPNTFLYFIFEGIGAMLYVVSMLFLLNSRQEIRSELDKDTDEGSSDLRTSVLRAQCVSPSEDLVDTSAPSADSNVEQRYDNGKALKFTNNEVSLLACHIA